ncbi:hypothetical protein D5086_018339 [Populus alba]|uniref:Uncharacterized protein n=1 Tax=Populus alba TaxID=43335 RepID=A0ACC4BPT1_POPAL
MFTRSNSDQEVQMCVLDRNCNSGLHCETCVANGNLRPRCTGVQPIIPTSKNGIRGLMLDMYDFQNDIWLCHSFGGNCYNIAAFWPTVDDTVQKNQRLVVFTSKSAKEAYVVEIQSESYYFLNLEQFTG